MRSGIKMKSRGLTVVTRPGIHINSRPLRYPHPLILNIPDALPREVKRDDSKVPQRLLRQRIDIRTLLLVSRVRQRVYISIRPVLRQALELLDSGERAAITLATSILS